MNATLGPQCYTCRKRQVRCDSNTPVCLRCQKDLRECRGYKRPMKVIIYQPPQGTQPERPSTSSEQYCAAKNREKHPSSETELQSYEPSSDGLIKRQGQSFFPRSTSHSTSALVLSKSLYSTSSFLDGALIKAIHPTTDIRFNLSRTYGDFFQLMPQRIGINPALDLAVETLLSAHSDICLGHRSTQIGTREACKV